jgi:plasmid stabilization system protein ParE
MDQQSAMNLEWSTQAKIDILEIFGYLGSVAGNRVALKIVRKIYSCILLTINNPRMGQREFSLDDLAFEFRRLTVGNYKIVYFVDGSTVVVSTIFDARQDPAKLREIVLRKSPLIQ